MHDPTIKVLGIYRLKVTDELFREQHSILYPDCLGMSREITEPEIRQQLESVVLVEVLVLNRNNRFSADDFTQAQMGVSRDRWQAAWAETYLSLDGNSLAVERWSPTHGRGHVRIAVRGSRRCAPGRLWFEASASNSVQDPKRCEVRSRCGRAGNSARRCPPPG